MTLLLTLLLACNPDGASDKDDAGSDTGAEPEAYVPATEFGPYAAGTLEGELSRESGETLAVQAWYPAVEADSDSAVRYRYDDMIPGRALKTSTPDCSEPRPVVVFSHGSGGIRWQSLFYVELLAARGWVVVAPDHTGNTFLDQDDARMGEMALLRPMDVARTFDWLSAQSGDPSSPLYGCVDPAAGYAVSGHSYGGYTSLAVAGATLNVTALQAWCASSGDAACDTLQAWVDEHPGETEMDLSDPRAWASVPMAPAGDALFQGGAAGVGVPMVILAGTMDDTTPLETEAQPIFDDMVVTPRALAVVAGAGHLSFSDACSLVPSYPECSDPDFLPVEDVQRISVEVAIPFLDAVRGVHGAADALPPDEQALTWTSID